MSELHAGKEQNGTLNPAKTVAVPQPAGLGITDPAALVAMFGPTDARRFCSFDPKTPTGLVLLDKCEEAPDAKLSEMANMEFDLAHFYMHFVEMASETTGEVQEAVRTCLIDASGQVYACVSEGVRKSVARLVAQHGLPPWRKPVPVVVKLKRMVNGHNWLTILNRIPQPETEPTKVRK